MKPDAEKPPGTCVLVVDDDRLVRPVLSGVLVEAGYDVVQASTGRQAIDLLSHTTFDVVLLDDRMPELSGVDVVRWLRDRPETRTVPAILITAADELADRVRALAQGATDYVIKPFEPDEILARVRTQLRARDAWQGRVQAVLRQRTAAVDAVERAAGESTPRRVAEIVCEELMHAEGVHGVTVVRFGPPGADTIGCAGRGAWGLQPGQPVPEALARYLSERARLGPWVERGDVDADDHHPGGGREPTLLPTRPIACAPILAGERVAGVLLAEAAGEAPQAVTDLLSAAIDFGKVAANCLRLPRTGGTAGRRRVELERIIDEHLFVPHYQPVVTLRSGTVVGYEALTRFDEGTRPDLVFAEAEQARLGLALETATLNEALADATALPPPAWLGLNVSPELLVAPDRLGGVVAGQVRPIIIELSEHEPIADYRTVRDALADLNLDRRLAIDDVGSGFSSLRHVLMLQPAYIKLDQTWVRDIHADPSRQALIEGLHGFATRAGCDMIAEGIETTEELNALIDLGVEMGQGFLLGRPAPATGGTVASP
jgi:EAL domain-containing protein (putative c-di-GMP-specific phosphodiesterase class I)/CheY-like chemotaxis protein